MGTGRAETGGRERSCVRRCRGKGDWRLRHPSTVNVTVPAGGVLWVLGATVAVKTTCSLISREVPGAAVSVVLVPVAWTKAANAVARLLASTDPIPVARS